MSDRVEALRARMRERGVAALLVTDRENRTYLSGFGGTAGSLLITPRSAYLITDFRYVEQARQQAPGFQVVRQEAHNFLEVLEGLLRQEGVAELAFEAEAVSYGEARRWMEGLSVAWRPEAGLVEGLRAVKDGGEIARIRRAMAICDQAFAEVLPLVRPGVREEDLAVALEVAMRRAGAERRAFDFIVASGPRSALPHGVASGRRVGRGEFVTFDFGAVYEGYHSDITRTVIVGPANAAQVRLYELVRRAQEAGVAAVRPGVRCADVDRAARAVIEEAGYGAFFGHGTGHGVGRQIHEAPRLTPRSEEVLEEGMVITVEPGVYLPGWGGVRIEDTLVVTRDGCEVLPRTPKELLVLGGEEV